MQSYTYVSNGGLEMKSKRRRRASEVKHLTDSFIVSGGWKEGPIHPDAAALNPLTPTLLTSSASSLLYTLGTMPHSHILQY